MREAPVALVPSSALWYASTGVYGAGDPLESLLKLIRFVLAPRGDGGTPLLRVRLPDREQTLNALLDEFQQALEKWCCGRKLPTAHIPL